MCVKIVICGSRNWNDYARIFGVVRSLPKDVTVIQGECVGADKMAKYACMVLGIKVISVPADWSKGKYAGLERNKEMLSMGITKVIAFVDDPAGDRGTHFTIQLAKQMNIPVEVYTK